ncbi:1-acyl-sn-glycerol-3-phosphate acyltransferase [Janibacter alkaliphilus]|uniref:1-acyl-sn-glycerol-3-phosphate acyltransferase n=1 Tax=Janibacter alkaliphilus TaxID=1069963 RepID=A0A852X823_9MICO|nr:lysophospholipid acyltransferase family protein [Janibacter alkaliphilus]NYG38568.1 1-acyl-sn-glycerol-3-phosphate acyltransferase [Janibacter alkaliphilus]
MRRPEPLYRAVIVFARMLFFANGYRFTLTGRQHVPKRGGAVMAINHTGYIDFVFAGLGARKSNRWVRFMAKKSIWQHPVAGFFMRGLKHIPVDRHAGAGALAAATEQLRAGEIVGVYPEATMSRSFEIKELKSGTARMARDAGVPILPTIIWGAQRIWTKDVPKRLGRTGTRIAVSVGEPIHVGPEDDIAEVTERLREVMKEMLDEVIAAYPEPHGDELRFHPARLGGTAPTYEEAYERDRSDMTRKKDQFTRKTA